MLANEDHDFIFDISTGNIFYNENGLRRGFGEGGITANISVSVTGPGVPSTERRFLSVNYGSAD